MLKVDVDGYDFKVLRGAAKTIKSFKPIIFIELCEYTLKKKMTVSLIYFHILTVLDAGALVKIILGKLK